MNLRADLTEILLQAGFARVGFTHPEPSPQFARFQDWIAAGRHAGMDYLARPDTLARRADPRLVSPGVRTILAAALSYANPHALPAPIDGSPHGRVASYAWGIDYHKIIPPRLESAARQISAAGLAFTDSAPILERSLAQRAGLGWFGRNSFLILPGLGSYVLLGELFLTLEIEPDLPFERDHCGSCRRCIDACPTGCIRPDRTLDSAGCISYLTIENKGSIPRGLRIKIGDWVFGCDICQQVCPWNERFAPQAGDPALAPRPGLPRPALIAELSLTDETFLAKTAGTPLKRAKRRGYLRNVCVALGNSADRAAVPALVACLINEPEPLVRSHAAWALTRLGGRQARTALAKAYTSDPHPAVRAEINPDGFPGPAAPA
jgi:epoxyqueuosine reductase